MNGCSVSVIIPGFLTLTCDLAEAHAGAHHDPVAGHWEFVEAPLDLGPIPTLDHPNCRCELAKIDSAVRLPPWWIAAQCDEIFGPTSPRLFFPLEK